jgi:hypothetical protein
VPVKGFEIGVHDPGGHRLTVPQHQRADRSQLAEYLIEDLRGCRDVLKIRVYLTHPRPSGVQALCQFIDGPGVRPPRHPYVISA